MTKNKTIRFYNNSIMLKLYIIYIQCLGVNTLIKIICAIRKSSCKYLFVFLYT